MATDTKYNFDFLGKRYIAFTFSILATIASFYIWFARGEDKFGTDFKGGSEFLVHINEGGTVEGIRKALDKAGFTEARVQSFELGSRDFTVQLGGSTDASGLKSKVLDALKVDFADKASITRAEIIGPTIGAELRRQALIATIIGLVGILIYVSWRFEFAFALGAVISLFHDVIVGCGVYLWAGHTLNMASLAAALTIVGYSVNDTIVIFDRVREEIFKRKEFDLAELINDAINFTLSRTIITTLLTLFSVIALYLFGGGSISDLSLFLLAGMVCGIYSTIYIASPIVLLWDNFRQKRLARARERGQTKPASAASR